ncbi:MAG: farnesyl diphosphate synthase [Pseudomonadota bacterium]|nr:farnesyl diphosphate synthase [Pseudomonadota bacterium]
MANNLTKQIETLQQRSNSQLLLHLNQLTAPKVLKEAIRYSILGEGKRVRPILTYLVTDMLGENIKHADKAAVSIELIHNYSLIHDDLPAMDDDDMRRGELSCHKKFNEPIAILAGDAIQAFAFEVLAKANDLSHSTRIALITELATAIGASGMVGGQVLDLSYQNKKIQLKDIAYMHSLKTGALIRSSVRMGGLIAGADPLTLSLISDFGNALGLIFQIRDDILDATADEAAIGKPKGSDKKKGKATYVTILGEKEATRRLNEQRNIARDLAAELGPDGAVLEELSFFLATRKR